jgi:hypothetical protein
VSSAAIETALISEINEAFRALLNSKMQRVETHMVTAYKMGPNNIRIDVKLDIDQ